MDEVRAASVCFPELTGLAMKAEFPFLRVANAVSALMTTAGSAANAEEASRSDNKKACFGFFIFLVCWIWAVVLPTEDQSEDERGNDRRVGLDDVLRRVDAELSPGDLFVGNGTGVAAVAGG